MTCPEDEQLQAFVEHALDPAARARIEAHLDTCESCRAAVGHVAATDGDATQLGRFRLDRELGRGGMGVVWEAWDSMLARSVAVKLLRPEPETAPAASAAAAHAGSGAATAVERPTPAGADGSDTRFGPGAERAATTAAEPEDWRRFEREVRITARLEHPSIVPVYDAGRAPDGSPYYVMRKVGGRPLMQLVDEAETLNQRLALLPHVVASAQAVAHAHLRGIIHRDLKPTNILVGDLGETIVIDWGLAKALDERDPALVATVVDGGDPLLTRAGTTMGSPGFMSPEQLRGEEVDARTDVYALGATLYHLLGRDPPHASKSAEAMMSAALAGPPRPIEEVVAGVPAELATIVERALAYDQARRYPHAGALAEDLQRFLTGQLVASHRYTRFERLARFVRRHRVAVGTATAATVALAVGGWIAISRVIAARDLARHQAEITAQANRRERERADELTLQQARLLIDTNPTAAVALVRPLAGSTYWREVRGILAGARAAGVPWGLPAPATERSLALTRDGTHALAAGDDGVIRLYDLAARTVRDLYDARAPVSAIYAEDERHLVIHGKQGLLAIVDPATGERRDLVAPAEITELAVAGDALVWIDVESAAWQLPAGTSAPERLPITGTASSISLSPDRRHLVVCGDHLFAGDVVAGRAAVALVDAGWCEPGGWALDSTSIDLTMDKRAMTLAFGATPTLAPRPRRHKGILAEARVDTRATSVQTDGTKLGWNGVHVARPFDQNTLVVTWSDGEVTLRRPTAQIEQFDASPTSPYVVAETESAILVWDLAEVIPRQLSTSANDRSAWVGTHQVIIPGGEGLGVWHDLVTGDAVPVADPATVWNAADQGDAIVLWSEDAGYRAVRRGQDRVLALAPLVDETVFVDADRLVVGTARGEIQLIALATGTTTELTHHTIAPQYATPAGAESSNESVYSMQLDPTGRWLAVVFTDHVVWRYDLAERREATITLPFLAYPTTITSGAVVWVTGDRVGAWYPDGHIADLGQLPAPADALVAIDATHVLAAGGERTGAVIDLAAAPAITGLPARGLAASGLGALVVADDHLADTTLEVLDRLTMIGWTLARSPGNDLGIASISPGGGYVIADTRHGMVVWTLGLPDSAAATARWADAITNAEGTAAALRWRR